MKPEDDLDAWLAEANHDLAEATTDELDIEETLTAVRARAATEVVSQHLWPDVAIALAEGRLPPDAQAAAWLHADGCEPCATAIADAERTHRSRSTPIVPDEDTSRHMDHASRGEERVSTHTRRARLLSPEMKQHIVELAQHPGWQAERIHAHLRREYNRHDISLEAIRQVLVHARMRRLR